ncbi:MAG: hypothetical protein EOO18_12260, partial [Chryseobacterium sp.]
MIIVHFLKNQGILVAEASAESAVLIRNMIAEGIEHGAAFFNHTQDAKAMVETINAWNENNARDAAMIITSTAFGVAVTAALVEG